MTGVKPKYSPEEITALLKAEEERITAEQLEEFNKKYKKSEATEAPKG